MNFEETDKLWLRTLSDLNEVQRRRVAAVRAIELGWGGVSKVCNLTGMSHHTIDKGIDEIKDLKKNRPIERLRKEGGGRKKITDKNPKIRQKIEAILDENTAGDPMSLLRWTNKSTYAISKELQSQGQSISEDSVGRIIKQLDYSLQSNRKSKETGNSEERDSQFRYINKTLRNSISQNIPIISVDTKKKELVGNFKNQGRRWLKKGQAEIVNVYDFPSLASGKAIPYGIYDIHNNIGFVNLGISSDTAEFAVASVTGWWMHVGKRIYSSAKELIICADSGGSNGNRNKLWKYSLWKFAQKHKLTVTVLHYPPGTSKWNKIEHRMFSFISMNWKGKPLRTYKIVLNLITGTTTKTGLKIAAKIDRKIYKKGKKIPENDFTKIKITRHSINPDWNYTLN